MNVRRWGIVAGSLAMLRAGAAHAQSPDPVDPAPAPPAVAAPPVDACADANARVRKLQTEVAKSTVDLARANGQRSGCEYDLDLAKSANTGLLHLVSYLLGETEKLPAAASLRGLSGDPGLARFVAGDRSAELLNRRLLVEALRDVAPLWWQSAIEAGPRTVDELFGGSQPLPVRLVEEVQLLGAESLTDAASAAKLVRAQRLSAAYQSLVRCADGAQHGGCATARRLSSLLETSGPLLFTHRIQRVWETPCSAIDGDTIASWLQSAPNVAADGWKALVGATSDRLFVCFLADPTAGDSFSEWAATRLPDVFDLDDATRSRITKVASRFPEGSDEDVCARAARSLASVEPQSTCKLDDSTVSRLQSWLERSDRAEDPKAGFAIRTCARQVRAVFEGSSATTPDRFAGPPSADEAVRVFRDAAPTPLEDLRNACSARRTDDVASFPTDVATIATLAKGFGEAPSEEPWRLDATSLLPMERTRAAAAVTDQGWLSFAMGRSDACSALEMDSERCSMCGDDRLGLYDCAVLADVTADWKGRTQRAWLALGASLSLALFAVWLLRWMKAFRRVGRLVTDARSHLERMGIGVRAGFARRLSPSRLGQLELALPNAAAWERWGSRGILVVGTGPSVTEHDVNLAGREARSADAEVAVLVHQDGASPDLGGVRAVLDWAARGKAKAVQVLLLSRERLRWASSANDLLDLVEESSLRGNPFEVRGRISSSSQFFDRERLVSGLLAGVHAGRWMVVTGLRRFGKSSLTLEVARRVPGPSSYVDLAGFHHEIAHLRDPGRAADAILRGICTGLVTSAKSRLPGGAFPEPPAKGAEIDAAELGVFLRDLLAAVRDANAGRSLPAMIILDEIEQAVGFGAERIGHAVDVLAIVLGRLRNAIGDDTGPAGARVGVVLSSALHPVLWAPLDVLAHQSIMSTFESVFVSALPDDAAITMMRSLGARQGIRFSDDALDHLVSEAQGMPLVLRRLGSATLELYDADRARQGALGALDVGIEGARLAVRREEDEGSPVRVWVESEIASPADPAGVVLRALAASERIPVAELRAIAARVVKEQLRANGIDRTLEANELERRSQEAASVIVRLLGASGLLILHGDPIEPASFELPDGTMRRILARRG